MRGSWLVAAINVLFFVAILTIVWREAVSSERWKFVLGVAYKMMFGGCVALFVVFVLACAGVEIY